MTDPAVTPELKEEEEIEGGSVVVAACACLASMRLAFISLAEVLCAKIWMETRVETRGALGSRARAAQHSALSRVRGASARRSRAECRRKISSMYVS